ncbi:MAG: hypothetical protein ACLQO7_03915 [Candidatus Bathyarchaeia archaeon]
MTPQSNSYSTNQFGKNAAIMTQQAFVITDSKPQLTRDDLLDVIADLKTVLKESIIALSQR